MESHHSLVVKVSNVTTRILSKIVKINPKISCQKVSKWHWLILAPMGALDYEYWAGLFVRFEFCCVVCCIISSDGLDIAKQFVKIPMPICLAWFIWNAKVSDIYLSVVKTPVEN